MFVAESRNDPTIELLAAAGQRPALVEDLHDCFVRVMIG
jgi:hypothetical protein